MTRVVVLAIGSGLVSVPVLFLMLAPSWLTGAVVVEFDTVDVLYRDVAERVARGEAPYRDFPLEYPVGCLLQLLLPRLVGSGVLAYRTAYAALMLAANALLILAVAREVCRREGIAAVGRRLAWYLACFAFLSRLIVSRLDVVPALLAFVAAVEWFGGRPTRGGAMAALGGLVKLFPALVVLPAGLGEAAAGRGAPAFGLRAFAIVFAVGLAAWAVVGGYGLLDAVRFHVDRGLEIESMAAGPLMLACRLAGMPMSVDTAHGSAELDCDLAPAAVAASRWLQVAAIVATLGVFARSGRRSGVQCTGALILASIATAPVLSPQFLIWVLPFAIAAGGPVGRRVRPLFLLTCALTFLIYPVLFLGSLLSFGWPAIVVLNLRNAMILGLWAMMAFGTVGASPVEVDDRLGGL